MYVIRTSRCYVKCGATSLSSTGEPDGDFISPSGWTTNKKTATLFNTVLEAGKYFTDVIVPWYDNTQVQIPEVFVVAATTRLVPYKISKVVELKLIP